MSGVTAPASPSDTMEIDEPTIKNPLMVPRSRGPWCPCQSRAMGGPPMEVAVPVIPEAAPAAIRFTLTGLGAHQLTASTRPARTTPAMTAWSAPVTW